MIETPADYRSFAFSKTSKNRYSSFFIQPSKKLYLCKNCEQQILNNEQRTTNSEISNKQQHNNFLQK